MFVKVYNLLREWVKFNASYSVDGSSWTNTQHKQCKLEGDCDFSSNSKVWAEVYAFFVAILNLIG